MKKVLLFVLLFLIVGGLAWGGYYYYSNNKTTSVVTIDINPSIELGLNEDNKVVSSLALNEDASVLLSDLNLKGLTLEEATELIVNDAIETGYIDELSDENDVVVTSYNDDESIRNDLTNSIIDDINTLLDTKNIAATVSYLHVTDDVKTTADEYGISNGKMLLIEKAVALDSSLNVETLAKLSIQGIQTQIKATIKVQTQAKEQVMTKEQLQAQKQVKIDATQAKVKASNGNSNNNSSSNGNSNNTNGNKNN